MGIRFSDVSNNASVNNITIAGFETDTINGESSIVLSNNGDGGVLTLIGEGKWAFQQNSLGSASTDLKQATLPPVSYISQTIPSENLYGKAFDLGELLLEQTLTTLENGNLATISYCQSVLKNGILIYEGYDLQTADPIDGYWIAFKQNDQNPRLLEKVGEVKMTAQFWNRWYDWTLKDSGDNVVKMVSSTYINNDSDLVESFITTLTYENGTLTAVDSNFDFGGVTALQLYNTLSGYNILGSLVWSFQWSEYTLDDDYYGMAIGSQAGWCYYRDSDGNAGLETRWDCVGFNVLTGETRWVTPIVDIVANVTNFNFAGVDTNKFIIQWFNHPNGISFWFSDAQLVDNGDNVNGVTCFWSPFYQNPNEVIYLTTRDINNGVYLQIGGSLSTNWYWDNENLFVFANNSNLETSTTATGFVIDKLGGLLNPAPPLTTAASTMLPVATSITASISPTIDPLPPVLTVIVVPWL
jgi:hypothetical protein